MIYTKFDNTLSIPAIEVPIYCDKPDVDPDGGKPDYPRQTVMTGVMTPLLKINNFVIIWDDVSYFRLYHANGLPRVRCTVLDRQGFMKAFDTPGSDNILQVQILPPYENVYKKINLMMFITDSSIDGNYITLDAVYYVSHIWDNDMHAYGEVTTYDLFETVAHTNALGFASNVSGTNDKRWIYNPNWTMQRFLNSEIQFCGDRDAVGGAVYQWWVDFWNNINLVDIVSEYSKSRDLEKIWMLGVRYLDPNQEKDPKPYQSEPAITNHAAMKSGTLYSDDMVPVNRPANCTDKNFEVYSMDDLDRYSTVVQDGDVKKNIITDYEYGGEVFGGYDYLSQRAVASMFESKVRAQYLSTALNDAVLALPRGSKVNVYWYDYDSMHTSLMSDNVESNIPLDNDAHTESIDTETTPVLNRQLSGQYYIYDEEIAYVRGSGWTTTMKLVRPAGSVQKYTDNDGDNKE